MSLAWAQLSLSWCRPSLYHSGFRNDPVQCVSVNRSKQLEAGQLNLRALDVSPRTTSHLDIMLAKLVSSCDTPSPDSILPLMAQMRTYLS